MPWTRSLLELPLSPVEVGSGTAIQQQVDLTSSLAGGSLNSPSAAIVGGPLDCDDLWTDLTSAVLNGVISVAGNVITLNLHAFTRGYGYRITLTWNSGTSNQTLSRFFIVRCIY